MGNQKSRGEAFQRLRQWMKRPPFEKNGHSELGLGDVTVLLSFRAASSVIGFLLFFFSALYAFRVPLLGSHHLHIAQPVTYAAEAAIHRLQSCCVQIALFGAPVPAPMQRVSLFSLAVIAAAAASRLSLLKSQPASAPAPEA